VLQGSKIEVPGSGYRTAFVRVVAGIAIGREGTVPIGAVVADRMTIPGELGL
jgi:hypothetical protein